MATPAGIAILALYLLSGATPTWESITPSEGRKLGLATFTRAKESYCAYTVKIESGPYAGSLSTVGDRFTHVLEHSPDQPFKLPSDAPHGVDAITCYRSSPVPALGDARVVDAGYAFFISSHKVSVFLHLNHRKGRPGKYAIQLRGPATSRERAEIRDTLARLNGAPVIARPDL